MNKLPYLRIDKELNYNLGIIILILSRLAITKRGKKVLTIDKIRAFFFLVTRPVFLNKVLEIAKKKTISIEESDYHTVDTLAINVDDLFDSNQLRALILTLSKKGYIETSFTDKEGFVMELSSRGLSAASSIMEGYFVKISFFLEKLAALQSESPSKLDGYINAVLKKGM